MQDSPDSRAALRAISRIFEPGTQRNGNKDDGKIHSYATANRYLTAMRQISMRMRAWNDRPDGTANGIGKITAEQANHILQIMSADYAQSSLNTATRALELHTRNLHQDNNLTLDRQKSEIPAINNSRAYTFNQTKLLIDRATPALALSIELKRSCGIRAEGLYTIRPISEQPPTDRRYDLKDYPQKDGYKLYTVAEKGALIRPVYVREDLAKRLEETRLDVPRVVVDRGVRVTSHYNLIGGNSFSSYFNQHSTIVLGYSRGGHGLRHAYAQQRMIQLQRAGYSTQDAKEILAKELGHFRASIVNYYLR